MKDVGSGVIIVIGRGFGGWRLDWDWVGFD